MRTALVMVSLAFGSLMACHGESIGGIDPDGGAPEQDAQVDARVDAQSDAPTPSPEASSDAPSSACCPIDPAPAGCMQMGGANENDGASCARTCDFFCSENWRIEKDTSGCNVWKYDVRQPREGENQQCQSLDAGLTIDVEVVCGKGACDPATQYCEMSFVDDKTSPVSTCLPIPAACVGQPLCQCVDRSVTDNACTSRGGAPVCTGGTNEVTLSCAYP